MAFGFPALYSEHCSLTGSRQAAREAIIYTFELLGWDYVMTASDDFLAKVPISGMSWGETFTVSLATEGVAEIRSACHQFQLFDWGKNRQNVDRFRAHFLQKEIREAKLGHDESTYIDEDGNTPLDRVLKESVVSDPE